MTRAKQPLPPAPPVAQGGVVIEPCAPLVPRETWKWAKEIDERVLYDYPNLKPSWALVFDSQDAAIDVYTKIGYLGNYRRYPKKGVNFIGPESKVSLHQMVQLQKWIPYSESSQECVQLLQERVAKSGCTIEQAITDNEKFLRSRIQASIDHGGELAELHSRRADIVQDAVGPPLQLFHQSA